MTKNIIKILPSYIAINKNQNTSIWLVSSAFMLKSEFANKFITFSPNIGKHLDNLKVKIIYLDNVSDNKNNAILNWNVNNVNENKYFTSVVDKINEIQPSLIEVEDDYRFAAKIAKIFKKNPVIFISHSVFAKRNFITRAIQYIRYIRYIKSIIFVSTAHQKIFKKNFPYYLKKTYVIHNSYNHIENNDLDTNYNSKKNQIIFAGRATLNKGYQEYLLAMQYLLPKHNDWQAICVLSIETNKTKNQVDTFMQNLKIQKLIKDNKLIIIRNLSNSKLFSKFCESKIAIFPTHANFKEGLPLVGIEAHMAKCAVISSNNKGFAELSKDNSLILETITPEEIAKKTEFLINNPGTLKSLALSGYNHVKKHNNLKELIKKYDLIRSKYV